MSITIGGTPTIPAQRPPVRKIWARKAIISIQNRGSLREKEIDLFNLRKLHVDNKELKPTIEYILQHFKSDPSLNLLAGSILVEFGKKIENPRFINPSGIYGRRLFHLIRLLILCGQEKSAKRILGGRSAREARDIRIMISRSDPNPEVRQTVPFLS
ncbi:MAG: hypothetical protein U9R38_05625 [Candidatus Margulisiibacteriota bacterium]|nr:hypothetical protein [Candidatus Margulisiibacteriota bacterium]